MGNQHNNIESLNQVTINQLLYNLILNVYWKMQPLPQSQQVFAQRLPEALRSGQENVYNAYDDVLSVAGYFKEK